MYHVEHAPPPANAPGLIERLVAHSGAGGEAPPAGGSIVARLEAHASHAPALAAWLARFGTLARPLDGGRPPREVLAAAVGVAGGVLRSKAAAAAAASAADAAAAAREGAELTQSFAAAAAAAADAAARDLVGLKRAELAAAALLAGGGKNADPAAAEIVRAQASAQCAEQLKTCAAAAANARGFAERAALSAAAAAEAVRRARLAAGDAAMSAEAEAAAKRAAEEAEAASRGAAEAAAKAEAARAAAEALAADAERWAAGGELPPVAQPAPEPPAKEPASGGRAGGAVAHAAAADAPAAPPPPLLPLPGALPPDQAAAAAALWASLEGPYLRGLARTFGGLRRARRLALTHTAAVCRGFRALLARADGRQALVAAFVARFNGVEADVRATREAQVGATTGAARLLCAGARAGALHPLGQQQEPPHC